MKLETVNVYIVTKQHIVDISLVPFPFYIVTKGHAKAIPQISFWGNEYRISLERQPNTVKLFNVTTFPTVIYTTPKNGGQEVLLRLEGLNITENNTAKSLLFLEGVTLDGDGKYQSNGKTWSPLYGFGLFDLPNWFWKGVAVYAAYKTTTAKKDTAKVAYGALTAASTIKAF